MSITNRCRLVLLLFPIIETWFLIATLVYALINASRTIKDCCKDDWYFWYREIYRPARYGSVYDE